MFVCHPRKEEAAGTVNRLKVNWPCLFFSLATLPLSCCRVVPLIRFSLLGATHSSVWQRRESEERECKEVLARQAGCGRQKGSWINDSCGKWRTTRKKCCVNVWNSAVSLVVCYFNRNKGREHLLITNFTDVSHFESRSNIMWFAQVAVSAALIHQQQFVHLQFAFCPSFALFVCCRRWTP